jgi:L-threonylcarbamoyladenylate synthase
MTTEEAVAAIRLGRPVVIPTDTVYGLVSTPYSEEPAQRIHALKGRREGQPLALMACDVEMLLECVPELRGRYEAVVRALLPGQYTLVLPNPVHRFPWLGGAHPETIGVRVPVLPPAGRAILERAGALVATSANLHGGPDPVRLADVPEAILAAAGAVVDGGTLPGRPSTVIDLTGDEPRLLREGAVPAAEALERARAALSA